jgi:hypothetical protein
MERLIRKTPKASVSGGGKVNVRGRESTKEDLRELKSHSRKKRRLSEMPSAHRRILPISL